MPRCLPSIICQKNCSTIFHLQYAAANGCQVLFLYPSFAKCKSMFFDHWDVNFLCISALNFLFFSSPVPFICKCHREHSLYWDATFYDIISFFAECSSKPFLHWLSGLSAICLSFTKWSNYEHYCHCAAS